MYVFNFYAAVGPRLRTTSTIRCWVVLRLVPANGRENPKCLPVRACSGLVAHSKGFVLCLYWKLLQRYV